ncbi:MAG: hypothetical protein JXR91_17585 [Deltaproteobacteria bacterium]|nr:hypothetical protein [Deltaproteobacteria bacterium]
MDLREICNTVYGDTFVREIGFKGATPSDAMELYNQGSLIAGKLETIQLPKSIRFGMTVDLDQFKTALPPMLEQLAKSTADVNKDKQDASDTMIARNNTIEEFDKIFSRTANLTSTLLQLADLDELASRVRPSVRNPGQTIEDARDDSAPAPEASEVA